MKTLVVALCVLAAAAAAPGPPLRRPRAAPAPAADDVAPKAAGYRRRPRSLGHSYAYDSHHYYEQPIAEYYTVQAAPARAHYELGARHVVRSARTQYHVQVPVTYSYTYETQPSTSIVSYAPAHTHAHAHAHSYEHNHYPASAWHWDEAW